MYEVTEDFSNNEKDMKIPLIGKLVYGMLFALIVVMSILGYGLYHLKREVAQSQTATSTKFAEFLITPDENGITGFTKAVYESNVIISKVNTQPK